MDVSFSEGDRVQISLDYHWAKGVIGTILNHPLNREIFREVPAIKGILKFYWVEFDIPQIDADGDGPYGSGEIDASYLQLID